MRHSTGTPTKAEAKRFDRLQRLGCICCLVDGNGFSVPEIHHITDCGRRIGHEATLPLDPWHHRGIVPFGLTRQECVKKYGPSLAGSKQRFTLHYGTELALLEEVNRRIA